MKKGDLLFAYGSLRLGATRHGVLHGRVKFVEADTLPNCHIYTVHGNFPFPGLKHEDTSDCVKGDVFEVTDDDLPGILDRFEGYPVLYSRKRLITDSGHVVWVYIYNDTVKESDLIESGDWLNQ